MKSRIYEGLVRHRRELPRSNEFKYRIYMMYLHLDELDTLFNDRWFWSSSYPNVAWFRRSDHFGNPRQDLQSCVRSEVKKTLGKRLEGSIYLLTHLRYFGCCMNPVSFFYCWNKDETKLEAIVAEVHNTPWGETHCYVLDEIQSGKSHFLDKEFHVSPFMSMDQQYQWRLAQPGSTLSVNMKNIEAGKRYFNASMSLREKEINTFNLAWSLMRYPFMTLQVLCGIYWQALKLRIKGLTFYTHPRHRQHQQVEQ